VTLTARNARISSKGETVYLWDDVVATRTATPERPAMVARMPDLTAQPDAGTAFTNSPVEVTEGASWLKGVGADLDHNASTLVLRSQVRGMYIRPQAKP
jgi:lipopolysaccharide export system protein LptC